MNKQVKPRVKNDSLKDIPKDVRHSLQFLDNLLNEFDDEKGQSSVPTLRRVKNVPTYARKSLEILDNILSEYDVKEDETRKCESSENLRVPCDAVSEEVSKSLEVLDQVLDEFQNEGGQKTFRRKQPQDGKESLKKPKHEDIRRSLEVLDSVLAEFDDCLESWDSITQDVRDEDSKRIFKEKDLFLSNGNLSSTSFTYGSKTIDGDTSHDSGLSLQEQSKVTSPPPIPKRSATTKLSDRNSGLFTFPLVTSQSFDSLQSESSVLDNDASLSPSDAISIVSAKEDDEVFKHKDNHAQLHCCTKCGCEIEAPVKGHMMENKQEKDISSSPFSERRKMFEDRIGESRISVSPLLERSFNGSSFKVKTDRTKECESEPTSLTFYKSGENDRSDSIHSSFASKYSPKATKVAPPRVGLLSLPNNLHHAPNCNCKERIRELQMKFAETRRLLKANKIKGLDKKPPSFVPPPPLEVVSKNIRNEMQDSNKQRTNGLVENSLISEFKDYYTSNGNGNLDSLTSEENSGSFHSNPSIESEENSLQEKLCSRCSKSVHLPLSETIEDIPKLLPTDALKRPHLGLSYSMEDDLCPGVKEILQTSTPRSGLLSRTHKTASLSTFSLSDSSLGYVSSQSDLELSNSPMKTDKVPVSNIKCSTLPEGMDLHSLPSYYGHDASPENEGKSNQPVYKDRNFNNTSDPQLRSSSAPPLPEIEKPKKKHFRVFSRKEKKDKKTNGELNTELVPGAKLS